ncbi:hypothetical protein UJ101_01468 [Flavobacteriaceae bacterium UJ101]|nr:hypothetical protein UJ101_01468 [Flavobacteriaceae bacterium UJ101]
MFEILKQNTSEHSSINILIIILLSFALSALISFTYEFTKKEPYNSNHFTQTLFLIGIISCVIVQAVGDSLARGLGMLGALSIIRFRTNLKNPRNICFVFASLAAGIACGVTGVMIATIGTLFFCIVAILLHYSFPNIIQRNNDKEGILKFTTDSEETKVLKTIDALNQNCSTYSLTECLSKKNLFEDNTTDPPTKKEKKVLDYTYSIKLKQHVSAIQLINNLEKLSFISNIKIKFAKNEDLY